MENFTIEYKDGEDQKLEEFVFSGLSSHMQKVTGFTQKPFTLSAYDKAMPIGGLSAYERNKRLYITYLFVAEESRAQGVGYELMKRVEDEAKKRGCIKIHVDSAGFQSPDFYIKLGYTQINLIDDFFGGYDWLFFAKDIN